MARSLTRAGKGGEGAEEYEGGGAGKLIIEYMCREWEEIANKRCLASLLVGFRIHKGLPWWLSP